MKIYTILIIALVGLALHSAFASNMTVADTPQNPAKIQPLYVHPDIFITSPDNTNYNKTITEIDGTAGDSYGVKSVTITIDDGAPSSVQTTNNYANWSFSVSISDGTHTAKVVMTDMQGQINAAEVTFTVSIPAPVIQSIPDQTSVTEPFANNTNSTIPSWVKHIFEWYSRGSISDDELIGALQFLIQQGIIKV